MEEYYVYGVGYRTTRTAEQLRTIAIMEITWRRTQRKKNGDRAGVEAAEADLRNAWKIDYEQIQEIRTLLRRYGVSVGRAVQWT